MVVLWAVLTATLVVGPGVARLFEPCELARELLHQHELPSSQIATWVCIARHESEYNTSAKNPSSGDHGLFQISELWWCSENDSLGGACAKPCSAFRDDDISDDVICARRIYREHSRLSGDGFNAWVVYPNLCKHNADKYLEGCNLQDDKDNLVKSEQIEVTTRGLTSYETKKTTTEKYPTTTVTMKRKSLFNARQFWNSNKITTQKSTTKEIETKYNIFSREIHKVPHKVIEHPTGSKYKYHINSSGFALFKDN